MRILKAGIPFNGAINLTCPDCGCEFEFQRHETTFPLSNGKVKSFLIICPERGCRRLISFTLEIKSVFKEVSVNITN